MIIGAATVTSGSWSGARSGSRSWSWFRCLSWSGFRSLSWSGARSGFRSWSGSGARSGSAGHRKYADLLESQNDEQNDIVAELRGWWNTDHEADGRGFCRVCSLRMPCDWVQIVDDAITAADEIERLRAENRALEGAMTKMYEHWKNNR